MENDLLNSKGKSMRSGLFSLSALVGLSLISSVALAADPEVKVGGGLELNYTYNFNKPGRDNTSVGYTGAPGNRNGYYFTRKDSTIGLNLAEISVSREATKDSRVGFALRIIDGEAAKQLAANKETGGVAFANSRATSTNIASSSVVNFYEASIREMVTDKLTVDAGILPTWIGYETVPIGTSNFLTKSFHFGQFQPFYHGGVKATFASDEKTSIMGAVVNNYNGTDRSTKGRDLGVGVQVAHTLSGKAKVYLNGLSGRDLGLGGTKHDIFNVVYTNSVSDDTSLAFDGSYTTSGPTGGRTKGYAYTGYLAKTLASGNTVALRGELLNEDRAGGNLLAFGGVKKPSLSSITASYELKQAKLKGIRTLVEYRYDNANSAIFPTRGGAKKNQSTLTLSQVFAF